jgi:hypothetical protein
VVGNDLLALELGGLPASICFGLGFVGAVLVVYFVAVELVANSGLTPTDGSGNSSIPVASVMERLYFIALIFREMRVVLSWSHSTQGLAGNHERS